MIKYFIDPITHSVVAKLYPSKEIKICNENMLNRLTTNGVTVSREFKESHRVGCWKVFPKDGQEVFAKAFEQFYFIHGVQQQGYVWKDKVDSQIPKKELAKMVLAHYRVSKANN